MLMWSESKGAYPESGIVALQALFMVHSTKSVPFCLREKQQPDGADSGIKPLEYLDVTVAGCWGKLYTSYLPSFYSCQIFLG
jgi:hypothetical protein